MTPALRQILLGGGPRPELSLDFVNGVYANRSGRFSNPADVGLVCTRSTAAYDLTTSGAVIPFAANTPRIVPGRGLGVWEARTQRFILPFAPATQSISLPSTGSYCLSVGPGGSVAIAAGTATISGAGTASFGSNVVINCTGTGTVTCTVTGSPAWVQLEAGAYATPPINAPTAATAGSADVDRVSGITMPSAWTCFLDVELPAMDGVERRITFSAAGSGANRVQFSRTTSNEAAIGVLSGNISQYTKVVAGFSGANRIKFAVSFDGTTYRGAINGSGLLSGAGIAPVGIDRLEFAAPGGGSLFVNGYAKSLAVYPTPYSDAQLQSVTA